MRSLENIQKDLDRCEAAILDPKTTMPERDRVRLQFLSYGIERQSVLVSILFAEVGKHREQIYYMAQQLGFHEMFPESQPPQAINEKESPGEVPGQVVPEPATTTGEGFVPKVLEVPQQGT